MRGVVLRGGGFLSLLAAHELCGQTISTVREAEFRSRWTDYQVDVPVDSAVEGPQTLREKMRIGPVDIRGGVSAGWEYSNETVQSTERQKTARSSFFIAPTVAGLYEKELGAWKVAARYSVGWIFYLDPDYVANGDGGNSSQTGTLDFVRLGDRLVLRSSATGSYGSGYDIERAQQTTRLSVSEALSGEYQLAEFIRVGASTSFGYDDYSNLQTSDDSGYRLAGGAFVDDFLTDKTAVRLELSAGQENRTSGASISSDRQYTQGVLRINYGPTAKLSFTGSAGVGYLTDDAISSGNEDRDGLRAIYSLSTNYAPTEKTSASFYIGLEGSTAKPEFNLAINWHPRDPFTLTLSAYQQSGLSLSSVTTNQVARGVLLSVQQQFYSSILASVSGGIEEREYDDATIASFASDEPYTFAAFSVAWQISTYLSWQTQLRIASRRDATSTTSEGQQIRASMSLSLTF